MVYYKVILIAVTISATTARSFFADVNSEICKGVLMYLNTAAADNCNFYYSCFNEVGYLQDCGSNYMYDSKTESCLKSDNVDCFTRTDDMEKSELFRDICMGYIDRVQLRVEKSCSKYYVCENEEGYIEDCMVLGRDYYFESSSATCVKGNQYNCINGHVVHLINRLSSEKIKVTPPTYNLSLCRGYEDGNIFGIEGSCYFYYICGDQAAHLKNCKAFGEDFQFDTNINDCAHKSIAKCNENSDVFYAEKIYYY